MANTTLLNVLIQDLINSNEGPNQRQATELLRLLTQTNADHRSFIAKNEAAMRALIHIISQETLESSDQIATAEHAIAILFHLLMNDELIHDLGLLGVVKPITQNVSRTARPIPVRENAAGALLCLATVDCHKAPIGIYGGIAGLISLMSSSCSDRGKQLVLKGLLHLLIYDGNKTLAARSGAAPLLLDLFSNHSHQQQASELALAVLKIMASHPEGASAIAAVSGVERIANAITEISSITIREKAALALLRIFNTEPSLATRATKESPINNHALYLSLNELSIHGSKRGRRAATSLLKFFMDMEVGDHHSQGVNSQAKGSDLAKEQDEQEAEEEGEEMADAGPELQSNYDELYFGKYPVESSNKSMDAYEDMDDVADDDDDDDDDGNASDDAHALQTPNYIEVPVMH